MKILTSVLIAIQLAAVFGFSQKICAGDSVTIPVSSPAFVFSPGNWVGDDGRSGNLFRQTWNSYAYFRVAWETPSATPQAKIILDTSTYAPSFRPPTLAYCIDGIWKANVKCTDEIVVPDIKNAGKHELVVCLQNSEQKERWGSEGKSGLNVIRVTGLQVDEGSTPVPDAPRGKWALIIGDSITEGIGASVISPYSNLIGQALQTQGYEYGISACGWSGWLNKGDNPPGDVPGYYVISNSSNGVGGQYDDAASRWNKIDGNRHSLLDSQGHISAYGKTDQEPSLILINYGTNDALHKSNPSDTVASITQCLAALRKSAPKAQIVLLIPFGRYCLTEITAAVKNYRESQPGDQKISVIDLGPGVPRNLGVKDGLMGGLHPNDRGHALFAAQIIPQIITLLNSGAKNN